MIKNFKYITGYAYELTHQVKGPLDYTIPYIMQNYHKTDTLTIAVNFEELSYMYYLKSKLTVNFGNNIKQDSVIIPDLIAYRKSWVSPFLRIFDKFRREASYEKVSFPVKDYAVNNTPELNYPGAPIDHVFKTPPPDSDQNKTDLYIRTK